MSNARSSRPVPANLVEDLTGTAVIIEFGRLT
jgi:hypothetical protein